jgi:hypothetical protein
VRFAGYKCSRLRPPLPHTGCQMLKMKKPIHNFQKKKINGQGSLISVLKKGKDQANRSNKWVSPLKRPLSKTATMLMLIGFKWLKTEFRKILSNCEIPVC